MKQKGLTGWPSLPRELQGVMRPVGPLTSPNQPVEEPEMSLEAHSSDIRSFLPWPQLGRCHSASVQFSRSVVSDSLPPHELQHARPPCSSPTPGAYSNSCPSHW